MLSSRKVWLACGAAIGLPLQGSAQTVRHIEVVQNKDSVSVQVSGEKLDAPTVAFYKKGMVYTFEWSAGLIGKPESIQVDKLGVESVSYGWFSAKPKKIRVRLKVTQEIHPVVSETDNGWTVSIGQAPAKKAASTPAKPDHSTQKLVQRADNAFPETVPPIDNAVAPLRKQAARREEPPFPDTVPPIDPQVAPAPATKQTTQKQLIVVDKAADVKPNSKVAQTRRHHTVELGTPSFPDTVPPLNEATAHPDAPKHPASAPVARMVSVECTNANITQVLKGLALQTGENILIGPGVSGKVTANLHNVSIDFALETISSMTGVKYAKVEGTYIFSSAEQFDRMMVELGDRAGQNSIIKVVPMASRAGGQVKQALIKMCSPGTLRVYTPGETGAADAKPPAADTSTETATAATNASPLPGGGGGGQAAPAASGGGASSPAPTADAMGPADYVILVGSKSWVEKGERLAKEIDSKIVEAMTAAKVANQPPVLPPTPVEEPVRKSYQVQSGTAARLKQVLVEQGLIKGVTMYSSPDDSLKQVIVCEGPAHLVDRVVGIFEQLDAGTASDEFVAYEVKFADPRALRESLIAQIPGLRATLPPNNVGNTGLFVESKLKNQATETGGTGANSGQQNALTAGSATNAVSTQEVSDGNIEAPFTKEENVAVPMRLLLRGSHEQIQQAMKFLDTLDIQPKQVALELRVMELSKNDALNAGIDLNVLGGGAVKLLNLNNSQSSPSNQVGVSISGNNFNGNVLASLDRIATGTNLIARPNVVALDGRQTEIFIGDIVRYIQSITNSQNGVSVTTGEVPVGVRLAVLPRVGADGNLTLDLRPRVSILKSFTPVPGGGSLPQTSTRFAQSTITMQSGQTIAIGGLIQDQDVLTSSGIPLLMDLPIIGNLFKSTTKTKNRTELVIFLTAREIDGPVQADGTLPMQKDMKLIKHGGH